MDSSRLHGKTMKNLFGKPLLFYVVERCRAVKKVGIVIVATSVDKKDDELAGFCRENNIACYRGSLEDVLERYVGAAKECNADIVVRITADCPLIDPIIIDQCLETFEKSDVDYLSNINPKRTFPRGLDVEVFSFRALERAHLEAGTNYEREHVTPYLWQNKKRLFRIGESVMAKEAYLRPYRLCVDYKEDFDVIQRIYGALYKEGEIISTLSAIAFLDANPDAASINAHCEHKPTE